MKHRPSPVAWLERRGVKLVPTGADRYRLPCPVHGGQQLSMGISRVDGTWLANCFACGFTGDAISLVMATASITFPQALKELECKGDVVSFDYTPPKPAMVLACDVPGCGRTIEATAGSYKKPGKHGVLWSTTASFEVEMRAELAGWWLGAEGIAAICPEHIA